MSLSQYRRRSPTGKHLIFVSGNKGKISELSAILRPHQLTAKDVDLPEVQTTSVEEVIREKVNEARKHIKGRFFVEDTGLYITTPPMNGFPGALIKFYYKHLKLEGICEKNGGDLAYAESIIGYWDGTRTHIFRGVIRGSIARVPQPGAYGFGWDSIFIPDASEQNPEGLSFAQIKPDIKNQISMRSRAGMALKAYLDRGSRATI